MPLTNKTSYWAIGRLANIYQLSKNEAIHILPPPSLDCVSNHPHQQRHLLSPRAYNVLFRDRGPLLYLRFSLIVAGSLCLGPLFVEDQLH